MRRQNTFKTKAISFMLAFAMILSFTTAIASAEAGTLTATVKVMIDGVEQASQQVTVAEYPVKDYITGDAQDSLEGRASVYDALLQAIGAENMNASWGQWGIYISGVTVHGTEYAAYDDEPVIKDDGGYTKYSGKGWTYTINDIAGSGASGEALTDNAVIVFRYSAYNYESGTYKATVKFNTPDGMIEKNVEVPVYPEKEYVTPEKDKLAGKASSYDALLAAVGEGNTNMSGTFIKAITIDGTEYASKDNETEYLLDYYFMLSSGYAWTYTVNDVFVSEYAPDMPLSYGDTVVFTYGYWDYCMDMITFQGVSTPYIAGKLEVTDQLGEELDETPKTGSFLADIKVRKIRERNSDDYIIIASYDEAGQLMTFQYMKADIARNQDTSFGTLITIPEGKILGKVKAFVWDGLGTMTALSNEREPLR